MRSIAPAPPRPRVLKFGGTSVQDAAALSRAASIVRDHGGPHPVVVVSALGGVTDALLRAFDTAAAGDAARASAELAPQLDRHADIAAQLLGADDATRYAARVDDARRALVALLDHARQAEHRAAIRDEISAYGERLSAPLLAALLRARGIAARHVDARHCVVTDDSHGRATPLFPETALRTHEAVAPLLAGGEVPVLGGYIAATAAGVTTTIGRGGGDYSAALIGAALAVDEIQIWTDVGGVLSADPHVVAAARTIPRLSYAEAAELAYFGAKVLHPRTMQPAVDCGIPVRIGNSRTPDETGTLVTADADVWPDTVKAIAHKTGITIVQITAGRMLGAYGFLRALFDVFDRHRVVVDVIATSEVSVSLTVDDADALAPVVDELRGLGEVSVEPGRAIVCVVGEGLRTTAGIAGRVFQTVRDINVLLISQGASRVNLTFVVDEAQAATAVASLHAALLEPQRLPA